MSEENNALPENGSAQEDQLSVSDAITGVITAPGETFETIANTPRKNYWIIPVLISIVLGLISTFMFMQDAELVDKLMDKQKNKMREKFEESIKQGKMTKEDADKAIESMNPKGTFFKIIGFGGAAVGPFIILLLLSVVYLIALKIMKAQFEFTNILNVVGLALLIATVGNLISMVVSIIKGDLSTLGLSLFVSESSIGEKMYSLISKIDIFYIWFYVVIAIGLSKIARIKMLKSVIVVFFVWIVYLTVSTLLF
jgi:hypothetical protein